MPDLGSALRSAASFSWPGLPRSLTGMAWPVLVAAGLVVAGPWILDTYTLNILVRAFFVAIFVSADFITCFFTSSEWSLAGRKIFRMHALSACTWCRCRGCLSQCRTGKSERDSE